MSKIKTPEKRIEFLAKQFKVFDDDYLSKLHDNDFFDESGYEVNTVMNYDEEICALYNWNQRKKKNGELVIGEVHIYIDTFINIVQADPTEHKEYVQWMLTTFVKLIKNGLISEGLRFIDEDLDMASEYLEIFHSIKNKPKFKSLSKNNHLFYNIKDPSNINQYNNLGQLFDAVDPFILKDTSKLDRDIRISSKLGGGKILYEDRFFIVYTPLTIKGSRLFRNYTNWCTTGKKETFKSYVDRKTPLGNKSKLYILIPKTFLLRDETKRTDDIYQLHFETNQYMNRSDKHINLYNIINGNDGLLQFFYDVLIEMAKACHNDYQNNNYTKALKALRFNDVILDVLPEILDKIYFYGEHFKDLTKLGKFDKAYCLYLRECGIEVLPPTIGNMKSLGYISLPNNKIKEIPANIGLLKKLTILNISGNKGIRFPKEITELDPVNGGSLVMISYGKGELTAETINDLKSWLPNVTLNEFDGFD